MGQILNSIVFFLFFFSLSLNQVLSSDEELPKTFIFRVNSYSKPSIFPTHYHWYTAEFTEQTNILHTYDTVFHGFSAVLTRQQVASISNHPSILAVFEDRRRQLHTTRSPQFLGLRNQRGLWSESDYGSDVIVGVFDTGIWPERRSFSDMNLGPIPRRWKGVCESGEKFSPRNCNRKLIGARYFSKGHEVGAGSAGPLNPINETVEFRSPRDADGHGTHTASTAAGRYAFQANMSGYASGIAKGVAPKARLAVYKVCWKNSGCFDSDILAAFDAAVNDGVDVISISIGGGDGIASPYYLDPIAIGSYGAVSRGVFVSSSAGNDGPSGMSVTNLAPWLTTVGAGTIDRDFPSQIIIGDGRKFSGVSLYSGAALKGKMYQLVYPGKSGVLGDSLCMENSLDPKQIRGKIVVCDRGSSPRVANTNPKNIKTKMERSPLNLMVSFFNIPPLWRECLSSAFRTALACTIVAGATLYGPISITSLITFPAFSYVVVILIIINDATLGDSLRGCWLGLYATIQSLGPAMLSLWAIGPNHFSKGTASIAVALAAFVVVLPSQSTHLIAKRISLGQIVLVYVLAYSNGAHIDPIMHPIHLAASTALGVIACVLALLLPYPRFACYQVNKNYKLLTNNVLKRLKLLVMVISEEENTSAFGLISRAKSLATKRTKLLFTIMRYLDGMKWERLPINFFKPHYNKLGEKLQEVDTNLIGMELALSCYKSFPINILDQDLKHGLNTLEEHVSLTIKNAKHTFLGSGSLTVPESNAKNITHFLQSLHTIPTTHQELPIFFFLFCAKLLHMKPSTEGPTNVQAQPIHKKEISHEDKDKWANWATKLKSSNLLPAIKYSFALGLSVFMGLLYSKESGFWSGLPVAVSYVSGREATFRAANVKAQGTVIGTVYGVLGCFVFNRLLSIRFLSLLPWFIFTSFLQRSRMYGPAGGISAVIGAVLILGRKNIGPPSEFAIERIIETFIGLSCSIFVDLLFWPKRASTCAKYELSQCLFTLVETIGTLSLVGKTDSQLEENQRKLKAQVNELRKFVVEAEAEPNFWFLPFHSGCYNRLLGSLSKLVDVLHFGERALKSLQQEFQRSNNFVNEEVNMLQSELLHVKEIICSSIKGLEEISKMKSFKFVEKEIEKKNMSSDVEMGKSREDDTWLSGLGEDGTREIVETFLQRSRDVVEKLYSDEGEKEVKSEVVLNLSVVGFCLNVCMHGTIEIEKAMRELVQWENPSSSI